MWHPHWSDAAEEFEDGAVTLKMALITLRKLLAEGSSWNSNSV
jgi:hypothetical protein